MSDRRSAWLFGVWLFGGLLSLVAVLIVLGLLFDLGEVKRHSLAGGFVPTVGEISTGPVDTPDKSFRRMMAEWNMATRDIDCMVREMFPTPSGDTSGPTTAWRSRFTGAELQEFADRCAVDFSRMGIPEDR